MPSHRTSSPSRANTYVKTDAPIMIGTSLRISWLDTISGATNDATPRINSTLMMLLPMTLPTATSPLPDSDACRLTPSSGALVPNATTVSPMTSGEIRNAAASDAAPRTSSSPPTTSKTNPTMMERASNMFSVKKRKTRILKQVGKPTTTT